MTAERCQRAATVDITVFLDAPRDAAWAEFYDHTQQCADCHTAVAQWTHLDMLLRAFGKDWVDATHPTVEQLAHYDRTPQRLPADARDTIARHLQYCTSCTAELAVVRSFDFAPPETATARERRGREQEGQGSLLARLVRALRSLVLQPAFAYGLVLLLGIRVVSQGFLPLSETEPVEVWRGTDRGGSPSAIPTVVPARLSPHEAAVALLEAYAAAYEARDLEALGRLWTLSEVERTAVAHLFAESRRLSVLPQVQSIQVNEHEDQAAMTFAQVTTVLSTDGRFYTKGPESYVADLRRREDRWEIADVRKVAD